MAAEGIHLSFCPFEASVSSVHEVGCPPTQVRLFGFPEGKLDSCQSDQHHVESVNEEDEEEEPEASVVALAVRLEDEVHLVEVGDPIGQMKKVHLRRKQNQDQTAAQTCRTNTTPLSIKVYLSYWLEDVAYVQYMKMLYLAKNMWTSQ